MNKLKALYTIGFVFLLNAVVFIVLDISMEHVHFQGIWASLLSAGLALIVVAKVSAKGAEDNRLK
ncbi:hypothetical protein [Aurantivibrio plasticivorans]